MLATGHPFFAGHYLAPKPGVIHLVTAIKKTRTNVHISRDVTLTYAAIFSLKVTGDNGESETVVLHEFRDSKDQDQRFISHVTFGLNFLLTLEDTKFNRQHNVVIGLSYSDLRK